MGTAVSVVVTPIVVVVSVLMEVSVDAASASVVEDNSIVAVSAVGVVAEASADVPGSEIRVVPASEVT